MHVQYTATHCSKSSRFDLQSMSWDPSNCGQTNIVHLVQHSGFESVVLRSISPDPSVMTTPFLKYCSRLKLVNLCFELPNKLFKGTL
jgi:hypothetical protein